METNPTPVSAQISVYPWQDHLSPANDTVRTALVAHGLRPQDGPLSTPFTGEVAVVFAALQDAFIQAAATGNAKTHTDSSLLRATQPAARHRPPPAQD